MLCGSCWYSAVRESVMQGRAGEELGAELKRSLERYLKPGPSGKGASCAVINIWLEIVCICTCSALMIV